MIPSRSLLIIVINLISFSNELSNQSAKQTNAWLAVKKRWKMKGNVSPFEMYCRQLKGLEDINHRLFFQRQVYITSRLVANLLPNSVICNGRHKCE
ncbi:hypothetical protein HUJ04_000811 [Dendroctonus ponderosae]|nr:hypothetical protein HUJ04_000811 [Dendroctonus ponderosae]KAH1018671.1 hypothetical protein HUJ05_006397 [Dendroctonus ponderosae]